MENSGPNKFKVSRACWGIHVGLTGLLAIALAVYDGLQHSYPLLMAYMAFGWTIPLALWPKIKKLMSGPVSPDRNAINKLGPPITLMVLGPVFILVAIFAQVDTIKVNGRVLYPSDPQFAHEDLKNRVFFAVGGLVAMAIGYFWYRRNKKNL